MRMILAVALLVICAPRIHAQQHQTRDWYCVRQPFELAETTDGTVAVLQCVAALRTGKLDAEDEDSLSKLERIRYSTQTKSKEMMNAIHMGFGKTVGQLCQKHPNIVLAQLLPTSQERRLYSCTRRDTFSCPIMLEATESSSMSIFGKATSETKARR
jgi:hypothetical protein